MRTDEPQQPQVLAALALTFNAFVWGISWWPFRQLQARGLHPLWATVAHLHVVVHRDRAGAPARRGAGRAHTPALWVLVLASGTTNAAFNWAVAIGDVVRVVLLFYLMPLWAVLLARLLLGERLTLLAGVRVLLALAGAAIVLWPAGGGWPLPASLADWLGVIGGFSFALNNVMLRRESHRSDESRALAMFVGGVLVAGALASAARRARRPGLAARGAAGLVGRRGAAGRRCSCSATSRCSTAPRGCPRTPPRSIMLTEVLFAAASALALGGGTLTAPLLIGGTLILLAALLSSVLKR